MCERYMEAYNKIEKIEKTLTQICLQNEEELDSGMNTPTAHHRG